MQVDICVHANVFIVFAVEWQPAMRLLSSRHGWHHARDVCVCQRTHAACIKHVMHRPPVWHRTMPSGHAACSASYLRRKVHALLMFTCQAPDGAQLGATALLPCMYARVTIRNTPCTTMHAWSLPSACACRASSIRNMRASICHQAMVLSAASLPLGVL